MEQVNDGPSRSGSVKRAREKAAAEERKRREAYEREYQSQPAPLHVRRQRVENQKPPRSRQQMPPNAIPVGHSGYGPRTNMIQPQPQQYQQQQQQQANQQWPLPIQGSAQRQQQRQPQYQDPRGQAQGRPSMHQQQIHLSMRQAPFVQKHSAQVINSHPTQGSQSREAESYLDESSSMSNISNMATPGTDISGISRDSQASSTGTIPDFPAPMPTALKPTGLGPPPSARRGPPSFYSVNSAVTPITEETPKMPATSIFDPSTSYLADKTPEERGRQQSPTFFEQMSDDEDAHIEQEIVRSASMGRRAKPAMVSHSNRDSDKTQEGGVLGKTRALMGAGVIGAAGGSAASKSQLAQAIQAGQQKEAPPPIPTIVHPAYREKERERPQWPSFGGEDSPIENKELDMMSSDSESTLTPTPGEHEMKKLAPVAAAAGARHSTPSPSAQSLGSSGLGPGREGDGLTALGEIQYNRNSAIRRPPKLNLNAVRDAEARGSLTSLPDLIRRATKLASMMNEGKRPASRLNNLNDFPMENSEKGSLAPNARHSGLSGMLAAFPNPGANGTPLATPRSAHWPGYASSTKALRTPHGESHPKPRRRCCGMPLWCFIISLILLLCVIAAAVVVPLKLTVLKDKDEEGAKGKVKGVTAIETCQRDAACLNGGTSVLSGETCSCICSNGYEGSRCETLGTQGCTTVNYFGTTSGEKFEKITVGNAIPRVVDGSDSKFSIPLFWEEMINQFGNGDVTCSGGNALVTISGATGAEDQPPSSSKADTASKASVTAAPSSSGTLRKRQGGGVDTEIALATGTQTAMAGKATGDATSILIAPTASPTSGVSTPTSGGERKGNITVSNETLDFARVAVLYVVQERSVKEALVAQEALINVLGRVEVEQKKNGTMPSASSVVTWANEVGGTGFIDLGSWNVGLGASGGKEARKVGGRGSGGGRIY